MATIDSFSTSLDHHSWSKQRMERLYIGAAYYPEHFPPEAIDRDLNLMAEAGLTLIRIGEFAWSRLEPEEGRYEFDWLESIIERAATRGIHTILCTPTAAIVGWLASKYPEVLRVDADGKRCYFGQGRKTGCYRNEVFRDYSSRITAAMADRFGNNSSVIGWQIDNEFGGAHDMDCFCEGCGAAFREWLRQRFNTVETLNEKLALSFWSMEPSNWEEIRIPRGWPLTYHPPLALEYQRFVNDYVVEYQRLMVETLRPRVRAQLITHNMMGTYKWLNYFDLAKDLDVIGWDNYFSAPSWSGFGHDLMWSLKQRRFWVLEEQLTGKLPENLRLTTYQCIARGADVVIYFKWRTGRAGYEQDCRGIVEADGLPRGLYHETARVVCEIMALKDRMPIGKPNPEVAILHCYDSRWAIEIDRDLGYAHRQWGHLDTAMPIYEALQQLGLSIAIVPPTADLSSYRLVAAPVLLMTNEAIVENLRRYVDSGGTLVGTFRSGVKDWQDVMHTQPLPGALAGVYGIVLADWHHLGGERTTLIRFSNSGIDANAHCGRYFAEMLELRDASAIAHYHGEFGDAPAVSLHQVGQGRAVYVGSRMDHDFYLPLLTWLLKANGWQQRFVIPDGLEVIPQQSPQGESVFVLNYATEPRKLILDQEYCDLITGIEQIGQAVIPARDLMILVPRR